MVLPDRDAYWKKLGEGVHTRLAVKRKTKRTGELWPILSTPPLN